LTISPEKSLKHFKPWPLGRKDHVNPVVGGVKGTVGEFAGGRVGVDSVTARHSGVGRSRQGAIDVGIGKVVAIGRIEPQRRVVRDDVSGVGLDGDRSGEVDLLPATGCSVREGGGGQTSAAGGPQIANVGP
jgi:hypothetical protein